MLKQNIPMLKCQNNGFLRPLTENDVTESYIRGMNSRAVKKFLMQPNKSPQTRLTLTKYVKDNFYAKDVILFGLFVDGIHSGNLRLHDISNASAFLGIAIFDTNLWGKGWGTASIKTASMFGVKNLNIKKIIAGIDNSNTASTKAFVKAGYKKDLSYCKSENSKATFWKFSL